MVPEDGTLPAEISPLDALPEPFTAIVTSRQIYHL